MLVRKLPGSPEIDADDAPELTVDMLDRAEVFDGDRFVRRGRGRPRLEAPKEKINVRVDAAVLDRLRASGPGWQTRVNDGLAMLTGVDRRLWDWIDLCIANNETEVEKLMIAVEHREVGNQDTTDQHFAQSKASLAALNEAVRVMHQARAAILDPYSGKASHC